MSQIHLVIWAGRNDKTVLEVWDDLEKAKKRCKLYLKQVQPDSGLRGIIGRIGGYKATVYVESFTVNKKYTRMAD